MKRMVTALMVCSMIIGIASIAGADARNFWFKPVRALCFARSAHANFNNCDFDALEDAFDAYFSAADAQKQQADSSTTITKDWSSTGVPVAGAHTVE